MSIRDNLPTDDEGGGWLFLFLDALDVDYCGPLIAVQNLLFEPSEPLARDGFVAIVLGELASEPSRLGAVIGH